MSTFVDQKLLDEMFQICPPGTRVRLTKEIPARDPIIAPTIPAGTEGSVSGTQHGTMSSLIAVDFGGYGERWVSADAVKVSQSFTFTASDGSAVVRLDFEGPQPRIWVSEDYAWNAAAKQFWNAAARIVGQPAPFPEAG